MYKFLFLKKLNSRFLVVFQSFFVGQIFANFGSVGQFWAEFAALTVVDSMPKPKLKSSDLYNS
jgi:hypothetical protein